jgi:hypothetical protein
MNEDKERAAFEEWASSGGKYPSVIERTGEVYHLMQTLNYWLAWKARAGLSGWNRCDDGLPKTIGSYLVMKNSEEGREIEWAFFNSDGKWCQSIGYFIAEQVTHWRELPKLPEVVE